jgi:hypothetical protein
MVAPSLSNVTHAVSAFVAGFRLLCYQEAGCS